MNAPQQPSGWQPQQPPGWQPQQAPPPLGWQPAPNPVGQQTGPGPGLLPLAAGVVLFLLGFLALSWGRHGEDTKYTGLLQVYRHAHAPHDLEPMVGFYYVIAGAAGLALLGVIQASLWSSGVVRSRRSAGWVFGAWGRMAWRSDNPYGRIRILAGWVQLLLLCLHGWGLWAVYDGKPGNAGPGAWMLLGGAFCFLLAVLLGPRRR